MKYNFYRKKFGIAISHKNSGIIDMYAGTSKAKILGEIKSIAASKNFKKNGLEGLKASTRETLEIYLSALTV